jgi:hypothetical protein
MADLAKSKNVATFFLTYGDTISYQYLNKDNTIWLETVVFV